MDKEKAMQQWDEARNYIANGGRGSWPRDMFESYLDYITKIEMELEREKQNDIIKSKLLNHLEAENERLRGALEKYGRHKDNCRTLFKNMRVPSDAFNCTCGFEEIAQKIRQLGEE